MSELIKIEEQKTIIEKAFKSASGLALINNATSFMNAGIAVTALKESLTDDALNTYIMPLMNLHAGFMTDCTGVANKGGYVKPFYTVKQVRDCVLDAVLHGLNPIANQFNIIAGRMYITKEGFTHLLHKKGIKYKITVGNDISKASTMAEIQVNIAFKYDNNPDHQKFIFLANIKKGQYDGLDQLKGKAERRAKKAFYEFLTGIDLPESNIDDDSGSVVDVSTNKDITDNKSSKPVDALA